MNRLLEILPMLGSLVMIALVLVLTYYATRWYAGRMGPAVSGKNIRVIDRVSLSNNAALVIACVCGKYYLLGMSEHGVTLIRELEDFEESQPEARAASFQDLLEKFSRKQAKEENKKNDGETQ